MEPICISGLDCTAVMDKAPSSPALMLAFLLMTTPALLSPKTTFTLEPTVTYLAAFSRAEVLVLFVSVSLSSLFSLSSFSFSSSLAASAASPNKSAKPRSSSASLAFVVSLSLSWSFSLSLSLSLSESFSASAFSVPLLAVTCRSVFVSAAFTSTLPPAVIFALSVTCAFSEVLTKFKAEPPSPVSLMLFSALTAKELSNVAAAEIFSAASSTAPVFSAFWLLVEPMMTLPAKFIWLVSSLLAKLELVAAILVLASETADTEPASAFKLPSMIRLALFL